MCSEATHGEEIFAILCKKSALLPRKIIAKEEGKKLVTDFSEQFFTRVGLLQEYFELKTSPGGKPHKKFEKKPQETHKGKNSKKKIIRGI